MRTALLASLSILVCSAVLAEAPDARLAAVERELLAPMSRRDNERSRFSRAWRPPLERRARITSASPSRDARGRAFVTFAVDTRALGRDWSSNAQVGCLYLEDDAIFIQRGEAYLPAAQVLGKKSESAPEGVCRVAPAS